jgi:hypothetical protein
MRTSPGEPIKAAELASGDSVSIFIGAAMAPNAVAVEHLFGTIMDARPKAIRLQLEATRGAARSLWLPRRALTHLVRDQHGVRSTMARWWKPDDRQARVVNSCRHVGTITA